MRTRARDDREVRVCIVGQGPSAEGKGAEIDACDFVVRIKAFWEYGAGDTGRSVDAIATYGDWNGWRPMPDWVQPKEYWFTQCPSQVEQHEMTQERGHSLAHHRLSFIVKQADGAAIRWLTDKRWKRLCEVVGSHPSTGFVAVAMAMWILAPAQLLLVGFDSVDPDLPNFWDARHATTQSSIAHNMASEKKRLRELVTRWTWLGTRTATDATWLEMPEALTR